MATPMRSTQFKAIVEPILNEGFDGIYDQRKDEWKFAFHEQQGLPRAYMEEYMQYGFGAAPELPDGAPVTYQDGGILYTTRYTYKVYGLAFAITKVLVEDGDHVGIGKTYSKHLAQSMIETKETLAANILNRAFNSSYTGGDGVSLVDTAHPLATGGTWSNELATPAALSQTSLEQLLIQISNAVDHNGKKIKLDAQRLVIPPQLVFQAEVILNSVLRSGTANNDVNPIKSLGLLAEGAAKISRLTSTTAWYITTNVNKDNGLKLMKRRALQKSMEGDFETDSMRYKSTERYGFGWTDPRGIYGTAGV